MGGIIIKKVILFPIILIFLVSFNGCSLDNKNDTENKEKITLTMWHIWSQTTMDANGRIIQDTKNGIRLILMSKLKLRLWKMKGIKQR